VTGLENCRGCVTAIPISGAVKLLVFWRGMFSVLGTVTDVLESVLLTSTSAKLWLQASEATNKQNKDTFEL